MKRGLEYWKTELKYATSRLQEYWDQGDKILDRYIDDRTTAEFRLNLFHSNVYTLLCMIHGKLPKTTVCRRHQDQDDDVARLAGEILKRMLDVSIGDNEQDTLHTCLKDRLITGLGTAKVRYDATVAVNRGQASVSYKPDAEDRAVMNRLGKKEDLKIVDENVPIEYVYWKDFLWGFSRTWSRVPWVAFRIMLDKEQFIERFGKSHLNLVKFEKEEENVSEKVVLYEIWCKETKKVYWTTRSAEVMLDEMDDPLELKGFFPCPMPMIANTTSKSFIPKADFSLVQDLYNHIDDIQTRISIMSQAIRVTGLYDSSAPDLEQVFTIDSDNKLYPCQNWASFSEKGGMHGSISLLPIKDIAETLGVLQQIRDQTVQLLYEVTGMADILRGHSQQYTAAATDRMKAGFASYRIQYIQDEFARFASQLIQLRAEIMTGLYKPATLLEKSNARYIAATQEELIASAELLKTDYWSWYIEVKSDDLSMVDYQQLQLDRTNYMQLLTAYTTSIQSVSVGLPEMVPAMLELMKWSLAGFKGSEAIEGVIDRSIEAVKQRAGQPQQEPENPKLKETQIKHMSEMQKLEKKQQDEIQKTLIEHKLEIEKMIAETEERNKQEINQANQAIREKRWTSI